MCVMFLRGKCYSCTMSKQRPTRKFNTHFRSCENPAFGKPWFCLSDTRHFRHFRRFRGSEDQGFWCVECKLVIFAVFVKIPFFVFSAGGKTTVSQNHRLKNPETRCRNLLSHCDYYRGASRADIIFLSITGIFLSKEGSRRSKDGGRSKNTTA